MDARLQSLFLSPVLHPGVVLQLEFLIRYGISQAALAQAIGIHPANLSTFIHGRRPVTIDLGRLLGMALATPAEYWLLRQLAWDLDHAKPLPLIVPMPQLRERLGNGARPRDGLQSSPRRNTPRRQPLRGSSGSKRSPDYPF